MAQRARHAELRADHYAGYIATACLGLERLVAEEPEWGLAWRSLGFARLDLERYDEATEALQRARALAPPRAHAMLDLNLAEVEQLRWCTSSLLGAHDERHYLTRARRGERYAALRPEYEFGWDRALYAWIALRRFAAAEVILATIRTNGVGRAGWRHSLAAALQFARRDAPGALQHHECAHLADADDAGPLIRAALVAMTFDRARAESLLRRATCCREGRLDLAWADLGDCLRSLGRFDEAQSAYRRALELVPHHDSLALRLRDVERCMALESR